ncbi:dihydrolipoamide acetyltransferase family protein [Endozoicomonas ascidiicola]|uniref:dihydrolipoamide acetyltransferase family protein n=1 Tax=Endozoicomonas ascidiicola TaxID=1698521 RepID=UPI00082E5E13|nr:dihydrolipoamide acetyltransferase family protein [Endozoicomonas ascidiicola]
MRFFNLPDLGEGIPEADIVEWHIKEGDSIREDDLMVSVETAKAVVDVPAPCTGVIARLCGQPGDTVLTGAPLVEFVSDDEDSGTVVGKLVANEAETSNEESFIVGAPKSDSASSSLSSRNIKSLDSLAKQYHVDLGSVARQRKNTPVEKSYPLQNPEPLKGVRKHMARSMEESHASVVPVTLFDDVDIDHWKSGEDITVRLIQALAHACKEEPALNAWFDGATMSRQLHDQVDLGLAVDSKEGLFVPVIRDAGSMKKTQIRSAIKELRKGVEERSLTNSELQGATITLSNFGVFAGKYATPIVVPPMVSIVGVGRLREEIVSVNGKPESHRMLPLSLSFDHRAATGGEATRFLHSMIKQLQK